jgi:hypothetical protein
MRFTFTLTVRDIHALRAVTNRRLTNLASANSKLFFSTLFTWIPLGVAGAAYGSFYRQHPELAHDLKVIAGALLVSIVLFMFNAWYKRHLYNKVLLAKDSWVFSEQTFEITAEGLKTEGTYGSSNYKWPAFIFTTEDQANVYLFVDNGHALVLPKSVFTSPEQLTHLKTWLNT